MENFKFYNPTKLIFGKDTIKEIGKEISKNDLKKVLILYGKGSIFKNGSYDQAINSLKEYNVEFIEVSGVKPNPVLTKVQEAIKIGRENDIDCILAIGGGSVIDTSKAVSAGYYYDGDVWDIWEQKARVGKTLPIFTILTISATGSEMNSGAVITNEEEKKKWGFGSLKLYPVASIIDPQIQYTLPKNQTINGAIDAMTHVFELYFDRTQNNDIMNEYSEGIIRTVMKNVKILLDNPQDYDARANLALSATLALNGSNGMGRQFGDWASHGIEHSLSAYHDISHGAGLAIIGPAWMKYVYKEMPEKWARFGEKIFNINQGSEIEKAEKSIEKLIEFYKELGAPTTLREVGIKEEELEILAGNAYLTGEIGNMKKLNKEDILKILKIAY